MPARHAAAALKLQMNKTDRNDAFGLARLVRSGWYRPVAVRSMETHRLGALLITRDRLVGKSTALIYKIRGLAKAFGILVGPGKGGTFKRQVRATLAALFESLLAMLSLLREQQLAIAKQLGRNSAAAFEEVPVSDNPIGLRDLAAMYPISPRALPLTRRLRQPSAAHRKTHADRNRHRYQ